MAPIEILLSASASSAGSKSPTSDTQAGSLGIRVKGEAIESGREGVIEWSVFDVSDHDPFHSFAGSNEIRLSVAARIIEAHGGSARRQNGGLCVRLPLTP